MFKDFLCFKNNDKNPYAAFRVICVFKQQPILFQEME